MTTFLTTSTTLSTDDLRGSLGEAQLAAAAFLARYRARTLEAYRYDLRCFFQWATDCDLEVLDATRVHLELYRTAMEQRGLAASTIDRRLSTVCGYYRFAHLDGHIASNPAQYVRRPARLRCGDRRVLAGLDVLGLVGLGSELRRGTTQADPSAAA
jgi:integrase/recombinase XerD